jgi:hypothetical protein
VGPWLISHFGVGTDMGPGPGVRLARRCSLYAWPPRSVFPLSFRDQPGGYVHGRGERPGGRICAPHGLGRGRERRNERANNHQENRSTFHGMGHPQELLADHRFSARHKLRTGSRVTRRVTFLARRVTVGVTPGLETRKHGPIDRISPAAAGPSAPTARSRVHRLRDGHHSSPSGAPAPLASRQRVLLQRSSSSGLSTTKAATKQGRS